MNITLVWETAHGQSANGFPTQTTKTVSVYATELSVTRSEVYESMRAGVTVNRVFEVRSEDYDLSKHTDVSGRTQYCSRIICEESSYDVVRAYRKGRTGKVEISVK